MFAYCNINPGNYVDPEGMCKNTFSIYLKADCGEEDCPHSKYYIENEAIRKTVQTMEAIIVNFDAQFAFGLGFYGEFNVFEIIGVTLGQRYDLFTLGYRQGEFYTAQTYFEGLEATFWYIDKYEFHAESGVRGNPLTGPVGPWEEDTSNDLFVFVGAGAYLAGGARFYIGIDTLSLIEDLDQIYN